MMLNYGTLTVVYDAVNNTENALISLIMSDVKSWKSVGVIVTSVW